LTASGGLQKVCKRVTTSLEVVFFNFTSKINAFLNLKRLSICDCQPQSHIKMTWRMLCHWLTSEPWPRIFNQEAYRQPLKCNIPDKWYLQGCQTTGYSNSFTQISHGIWQGIYRIQGSNPGFFFSEPFTKIIIMKWYQTKMFINSFCKILKMNMIKFFIFFTDYLKVEAVMRYWVLIRMMTL